MPRFWVLGPVKFSPNSSVLHWGVVDGRDLTGQKRAAKPEGFQEFWLTEAEAQQHADELNEGEE